MKKTIQLFVFFIVSFSFAQVGIGTTTPNASSLLDVSANNKGILIPRINLLATNNASPITSPATSLLIYNLATAGVGVTSVSPGYYYWDGAQWVRFGIGDVKTAENGLYLNAANSAVRLGGSLIQNTTITQGARQMSFNLNGLGDFNVKDNGITRFQVLDNGRIEMSGTTDANGNTNSGVLEIANSLRIDGNEIITNTNTSLFLQNDNNGDLRVDNNSLFVDASANRVSVGTLLNAGKFNVLGNSYFSDDIHLRDGAVNSGDILVRIYDSFDDGVIDIYENNVMNHRIHGNSTTIFNEQGLALDFRIESDTNPNMVMLDASENLIRFGTGTTTSDYQNGTAFYSALSGTNTTINYVADFDAGSVDGTTIGIGSIEYLVDGLSETFISDVFSPTTDLMIDMGWENSWDDIYADNFVNISDKREKKKITNISYGLEEILKMRPVSYILKRDPFQETKIGLIAQEVLPLVPEVVKTHDWKKLVEGGEYEKIERKMMGMTYQQLIPVLIKAIQEQQEQIDNLKKITNNINSLKTENKILKKEFAEIKSLLKKK